MASCTLRLCCLLRGKRFGEMKGFLVCFGKEGEFLRVIRSLFFIVVGVIILCFFIL